MRGPSLSCTEWEASGAQALGCGAGEGRAEGTIVVPGPKWAQSGAQRLPPLIKRRCSLSLVVSPAGSLPPHRAGRKSSPEPLDRGRPLPAHVLSATSPTGSSRPRTETPEAGPPVRGCLCPKCWAAEHRCGTPPLRSASRTGKVEVPPTPLGQGVRVGLPAPPGCSRGSGVTPTGRDP